MKETSIAGWLKLHRELKKWEWYDDHNTCRLFIHLLLSVNYEPKNWRGVSIGAGSMATSYATLSEEVKLSVRQIRVSMDKLKSTNDISVKTSNKFQIITVTNWGKYQAIDDKHFDKQLDKQNDKQKSEEDDKQNDKQNDKQKILYDKAPQHSTQFNVFENDKQLDKQNDKQKSEEDDKQNDKQRVTIMTTTKEDKELKNTNTNTNYARARDVNFSLLKSELIDTLKHVEYLTEEKAKELIREKLHDIATDYSTEDHNDLVVWRSGEEVIAVFGITRGDPSKRTLDKISKFSKTAAQIAISFGKRYKDISHEAKSHRNVKRVYIYTPALGIQSHRTSVKQLTQEERAVTGLGVVAIGNPHLIDRHWLEDYIRTNGIEHLDQDAMRTIKSNPSRRKNLDDFLREVDSQLV